METIDLSKAPELDIDPYSVGNLVDPYASQVAVRETAPVVFIPKYGIYGVGRHEHVQSVLANHAVFTSTSGPGLSDSRKAGAWRIPSAITEVDPPLHGERRKVLTDMLAPKILKGWRETFFEEAEQLVDSFRGSATVDMDAVKAIAEAYVLKVFPDVMGLGPDREPLLVAGNHTFNSSGPKNAIFEDSLAKFTVIQDNMQRYLLRENIVPGGFAEGLYQAEDDGRIEKGIASKLFYTFVRGGFDTTISGIGSALLYLAKDPGLYQRLRTERGRLKMVFEEAIRLESPAITYCRMASQPTSLGGVAIEPEIKVQLFLNAANRDPRQFPAPDTFDIDRKGGHIAFGYGVHNCVGQLIARTEAEAIFTALLDRVEKIELIGEAAWRPMNSLRTLDTLPLRLTMA